FGFLVGGAGVRVGGGGAVRGSRRWILVTLCATSLGSAQLVAQVAAGQDRVIPLPEAIRRAYAAGTRDSSGRPGPNYWQISTDYTIQARLDIPTSLITGRATIRVTNTSPTP